MRWTHSTMCWTAWWVPASGSVSGSNSSACCSSTRPRACIKLACCQHSQGVQAAMTIAPHRQCGACTAAADGMSYSGVLTWCADMLPAGGCPLQADSMFSTGSMLSGAADRFKVVSSRALRRTWQPRVAAACLPAPDGLLAALMSRVA
jgi:hypothetical protein